MKRKDIFFEEALSDDWSQSLDYREVPLDDKPLSYLQLAMVFIVVVVLGQIIYLGFGQHSFYAQRAENNLSREERIPAPRGLIVDRFGKVLADNRPVFSALLDVKEFFKRKDLQAQTLEAITRILGMSEAEVRELVPEDVLELSAEPVILKPDVTQEQQIALRGLDLPTLAVKDGFQRTYPNGSAFASIVGYIGLPTRGDLKANPNLHSQDTIGKAGLELFYDEKVKGVPGILAKFRDAKGNVLGEEEQSSPKTGETLRLTIDAEFQSYFYKTFQDQLARLGRTSGAAIAMNPQNGEVLALMSFPSFDNNLFVNPGNKEEKQKVLLSGSKPLFNRAVSGNYSPGSTIKPLVGLAAIVENVVTPTKIIFSPGYLDIPNPYNPDNPTRYLDWRYQGDVDLSSAIAQSSDVYFYIVAGGGGFNVKGLGISRLHDWWEKFKLGIATGIDLPNEAKGFLPTPEWRERATGRPWLLGDTYNVSIGQGDLLMTPIQLVNYTAAIANGGKIYKPVIAKSKGEPEVLADLTNFADQWKEVEKGMAETVTAGLGTAHTMSDLPFKLGAKTGSAQVMNNTQENAFITAYAPFENPEIAILVLIENSKEGSLNAVPVAKEALRWYYENRIQK